MLNRLLRRLHRDQRGAVLVMTVPVLILSMVASALSVDIGRQVVEKRSDPIRRRSGRPGRSARHGPPRSGHPGVDDSDGRPGGSARLRGP